MCGLLLRDAVRWTDGASIGSFVRAVRAAGSSTLRTRRKGGFLNYLLLIIRCALIKCVDVELKRR